MEDDRLIDCGGMVVGGGGGGGGGRSICDIQSKDSGSKSIKKQDSGFK